MVSERDLRDARDEDSDPRDSDLRHLRDEGLMRFVAVDGRERAVTLTERGHHLLEAHRRDRDDGREQAFYASVNRPRELAHDAQLYRAYHLAVRRIQVGLEKLFNQRLAYVAVSRGCPWPRVMRG